MVNTDKIKRQIGERIIKLRTEKRMSMKRLAKESGISKSTLSAIEKGISDPRLTTLAKIAKCFGMGVPELTDFRGRDW